MVLLYEMPACKWTRTVVTLRFVELFVALKEILNREIEKEREREREREMCLVKRHRHSLRLYGIGHR